MHACRRQLRPVRGPPLARLAVLGVEIENVDAGDRAGRYAGQRARIVRPELLQRSGIAARILEAVGARRRLVARAREAGILARQSESDGEAVHSGPPWWRLDGTGNAGLWRWGLVYPQRQTLRVTLTCPRLDRASGAVELLFSD